MARDSIEYQNKVAAIKITFTKISKGKGAKWRSEEVVKEVARMFYLKPKTIYNILAS